MEPEQPKPPPATYVRVRPEDIQTSCERTMWTQSAPELGAELEHEPCLRVERVETSCDTKHWPQSVQEPCPELDEERDLSEHAVVVDDVE